MSYGNTSEIVLRRTPAVAGSFLGNTVSLCFNTLMNTVIDRKKLFRTLTRYIILLFVITSIAVKLYWYYSIWYFDMITHFLGGFCVGLAVLWLLSYKTSSPELTFKLIYKVVLGVLLIGISWEIFEILFNNIIAQNSFNLLDTLSDIFFDLSGGLYAILYLWIKQQKKKSA
jgi:hypothetical protein